jgi:hypothetical protein
LNTRRSHCIREEAIEYGKKPLNKGNKTNNNKTINTNAKQNKRGIKDFDIRNFNKH